MAYTKKELLTYFSELDVATLEKLYKYASLLIIPEEDLLVNATMVQMVDKAHELADSLFPEWTDRSKSDFGEFLVELFALFSEKNFWYINAFANESLLQKMRSYSNAYLKAASMGYQARLCTGAFTTFDVSFTSGEDTLYGRGDLIVKIGSLAFSNDEEFSVPASSSITSKVLTLYEGTQTVDNITYNGHSIALRQEKIDINSIRLFVGELEFTRVSNFGQSSINSPHFLVLPEEDGSASIFFGSNGFGIEPQIGTSMEIIYRTCSGNSGNAVIQGASISSSLSAREARSVIMLNNAFGGNDPETLTSIKETTPLFFTTKKSIINKASAIALLESFPFVKKANAFLTGNVLNYQVIPTSGELNPVLQERLILSAEFDPYVMMGYTCHYTENSYVDLLNRIDETATHLVVDVILLRTYNTATVETKIRQIIQDVTDPLINASYEGTFNRTDMEIKMRLISGVQSVVFKKRVAGVNEIISSDIQLGEREIFSTFDQDKLLVQFTII